MQAMSFAVHIPLVCFAIALPSLATRPTVARSAPRRQRAGQAAHDQQQSAFQRSPGESP